MKLFTGADQPVTHIRAELCDVRLILMQTKFCLHPLVRLSFRHQAGAPQAVKSPVCLDTFMPQITVCQRAQRESCGTMGGHVAVAGGVTVTDIQILVCAAVVSIHKAGRV